MMFYTIVQPSFGLEQSFFHSQLCIDTINSNFIQQNQQYYQFQQQQYYQFQQQHTFQQIQQTKINNQHKQNQRTNVSIVLYGEILPGELYEFSKKFIKRVENEYDNINNVKEATIICKILSKLYGVIITDCCQIAMKNSNESLYKSKINNLVDAINKLFNNTKTLQDILHEFAHTYNLTESCVIDSEEINIILPTELAQLLDDLYEKYNWYNQSHFLNLKYYCRTLYNYDNQEEINKKVDEIILAISYIEENCTVSLTPYILLDQLMDKFI